MSIAYSNLGDAAPSWKLRTWLLIVSPILAVVYWLIWIVYTRTFHPLSKVPGPFWASISRTWYMYRVYAGDMEVHQKTLHARFGSILRIAPDEVSISDPNAIPEVYRSSKPLQKTDYYTVWRNTEITSKPDLFTSIDEVEHAKYRKIVNTAYLMSNVLKSESKVDECTRLFLQRIGEHADKKLDMDFGQWLEMYAYDNIGEVSFGKRFGFLETSSDYGSYIHSIDTVMPVFTLLGTAPSYIRPFILYSSILIPSVFKAVMAVTHMQKEAIAIAERKKIEVAETQHKDVPRIDVLSQLFQIVQERGNKSGFGHGEATNEAYVSIFAGADSTSIALRSIFYHLLHNPSTLRRTISEIDAATSSQSPTTPISFSQSKAQLPYTQAVIKEAMRVFPAVQLGMQRHPPKEGLFLCNTYIPAGYRVGINPAVVQFDKTVFGEDAEAFRPERWLEAGEQRVRRMEKAMMVFSQGARACTGQNIAQMQLQKLVPEILRHYHLKMAHDRPWSTRNSFFNKQKDFIVHFERRQHK